MYEFRPMTAADLPLIKRWQMIGEPDMIERGHGSAFIRSFIEGLLAAGVPRVVTDPNPTNGRAIRCYEKAGFARDRLVDTADGVALLMIRNASAP